VNTPAQLPEILLPDDLIERDQWVLWRREGVGGREAKVPYSVRGSRASSTDPADWSDFNRTADLLRRQPLRYAGLGYAGLGFVFSSGDPFVGIDLDDCLDPDGTLKSWAQGLVERFSDTYMEVSPSGQGLKIWTKGRLPANLSGVRLGDGQIEMYDHSRYFTVTGRAFQGAPLEVEDHVGDVLLLYERLNGNKIKQWPLQPLVGGRIPFGQQHNTLVSLAGTLRRRRVCDQAIEACLRIVNELQCERPGARTHISQIVRSSRKWGATA
jgi:primase-polymerase (primpol)-like protein